MRLYAEYMKEREDAEVIYDEHCFLAFKQDGEEVFVFDMFSDKEVRGTGYMVNFCKKFCEEMKERNVKEIYGTTDTSTNGWEHSNRVLLIFGFQFLGIDPKDDNIRNYCLKL